MFGTLRPRLCGVGQKDRDAYRQAYCGMCKSMGSAFGSGARVLVNHDVVLFALLMEACGEQESETGSCRCPVAPWRFRPIIVPASGPMLGAAGMGMLLANEWLEDQKVDGNRLAAAGGSLIRPWLNPV